MRQIEEKVVKTMEENLKEFAAKFGEEAARTIADEITVHNWPYGKPNKVFSVGEQPVIKENIFAATVKGVSYLGNIDDFNQEYIVKSDEFSHDIPLGYTTLDIYERACVFEEGECIWENAAPLQLQQLTEEELRERKLEAYVRKEAEHYSIFLPDRSFDGKLCIWLGNMQYPEYVTINNSNKEEVIKVAKEYSKQHKVPCLVAKRIYCCNWH